MTTQSTHPDTIAKFRDTTKTLVPYNWAQRTCEVCRRRRSVGQFREGSKICKVCETPGG